MLNMFLKSTSINIIQDTTMAFEGKPGVSQRSENLEEGAGWSITGILVKLIHTSLLFCLSCNKNNSIHFSLKIIHFNSSSQINKYSKLKYENQLLHKHKKENKILIIHESRKRSAVFHRFNIYSTKVVTEFEMPKIPDLRKLMSYYCLHFLILKHKY